MADTLKIEDIKEGSGEELKDGDLALVHYEGSLLDGTKFDSSRERDEPFEVRVGGGYVIKGWDMGLPGMKVGGKRRLTIPSELGYGRYGVDPDIPGDATLVFEIELLEIK
jgi:FKBP-type peptidyl-prolyl cis-trans isomerase